MRKILMTAVLVLLLAGLAHAKEISFGVLSDLSGPTSGVGAPYAEGVMDATKHINSQGGVAGMELKALQVDYAYNVQQALAAYKRFKSQGIVCLQGWGSGDTEALVKFVAKDQIPVLSASYSAHLADPKIAPYNFFIATDYSTQARVALNYIKENWQGEAAPKLAFIYPNNPFGLAPIAAAKAYAEANGFEIVGEENVELRAMDATTQLLSLKKNEPDFAWVGGTTPSTAVIMKDAKKLGMKTVFVPGIWGADENIFKLAGEAAEGHFSIQGAVVYGDDVPGMAVIKELTGGEPKMTHYIRGFASVLVMAEAMKMAAEKGEVTGPAIKEALEGLRGYSPMGLTPAISFFPDDHRPNMSMNIYKLHADSMEFLATQSLERKDEWLGH